MPSVLLLGASFGPSFPAFQTMLAAVNPDPAVQQRAFAVGFTAMNAGIGAGGAIGADRLRPANRLRAGVHRRVRLRETFLAPTVSPLVNSLTDDRVRGRANALVGMAYSAAFVASPAICTG